MASGFTDGVSDTVQGTCARAIAGASKEPTTAAETHSVCTAIDATRIRRTAKFSMRVLKSISGISGFVTA